LGIDPFAPRRRSDMLAEQAVRIVPSDADATLGRLTTGDDEVIETTFSPLPSAAPATAAPSLLQGQSVTEDFLAAAAQRDNFRMGTLPGGSGIALVCGQNNTAPWHFVGRFGDEA